MCVFHDSPRVPLIDPDTRNFTLQLKEVQEEASERNGWKTGSQFTAEGMAVRK
jgi:hypothetical protein